MLQRPILIHESMYVLEEYDFILSHTDRVVSSLLLLACVRVGLV